VTRKDWHGWSASRNGSPADPGAFIKGMTSGEPRGDAVPVAVCSDDRALRELISVVLAAAGHAVLARSATVERLLGSCNGTLPACVVVSADRPGRSTSDTVRLIRSRLGRVPAVLVCRRAGAADVRRALELGVDGVVLAANAEDALAAVVVAVCAGQVSAPAEQRRAVRPRALTTREKQILKLVVAGLTNSQIAGELFLAESTVKSHLSSAFGKLGVSSRSEAVAMILDPERGDGLGMGRVMAGLAARA